MTGRISRHRSWRPTEAIVPEPCFQNKHRAVLSRASDKGRLSLVRCELAVWRGGGWGATSRPEDAASVFRCVGMTRVGAFSFFKGHDLFPTSDSFLVCLNHSFQLNSIESIMLQQPVCPIPIATFFFFFLAC